MKHAYLITAHDSPELLQRLLKALDDERNDIYIHLDRKCHLDVSCLKMEKSILYILPERISVYWGDVSQIKAQLLLIGEMLPHGPYAYCHLLSGSDFPIKSQNYIHAQCELLAGKEFIGYAHEEYLDVEISRKVRHYHLYPHYFRNGNLWRRAFRYLFLQVQYGLKYERNKQILFKKGSILCSITYDFARYVYQRRNQIIKTYGHTFCADEIFLQTACWDSRFKKNIYCLDDEFAGCLRYIKWHDHAIQAIPENEIQEMINSDRWFARKFSESQLGLVDTIAERLNIPDDRFLLSANV